jgi:hypothetical protein
VHIVVKGLLECGTEYVMVYARGVREIDVVVGEGGIPWWMQGHTIFLRMLADGRMHGAGKTMEKSGLDAAGREQLAHVFQGIDGILRRLGGEAIHQVGMHQDPGIGKGARHPRDLLNRYPFLHQLEQPIRGHFQPARHRDAAAVGEQPAQTHIE